MSPEELLVLRKTLTDLLSKGWIRPSSLSATSPVLFAKEPSRGLQFYVEYRGLNAIAIPDRYPLPLFKETPWQLSKEKWFTKLDVKSAFHRNPDRYVALHSRVSFIYQNLGPGPKSFLDRYLSDDGNFSFESLEEAWSVLDVSFRNPNEEEDARSALTRLHQDNRSFGAYLSEFQRLQNLSGIVDDKTLISYMQDDIATDLKKCFHQQRVMIKKYSFDEFVALCKECVTPRGTYPVPLKAVAVNQELGPAIASGSNKIPLGGDTMIPDKVDVSHIGADEHLTPEERERRFCLKLCMRSGKPGHRANKCRTGRKDKLIQQLDLDSLEDGLDLDDSNLKD
ncbi:hypothetical protein K3495_g2162 [Podosphaera aphanis]|nr:hypothetical protein K3495_g2162 [Podosphaera aphanis]